jgi:3',5'-nucleoside bisphosphate phosphatase
MHIDLHLHSTASDGTLSPAALVEAAVAGHLDVIALSDHDTVAGVAGAIEAARGLPIEVIPAIEVSSTWGTREIHILGYDVDPGESRLARHAHFAEDLRAERIRKMIRLLGEQGVEVSMDAVLEAAGPEAHALGRPHLARALVVAGHASSVPDAFDRLIGDGHRAFLPTSLVSPEEAVRLIEEAGGTAVWAHPPSDLVEELLPALVRAGLMGLEIYRPRAHPDRMLRLEHLARTSGLLRTGGSDWHGPDGGIPLGTFWVSEEEVGGFLESRAARG